MTKHPRSNKAARPMLNRIKSVLAQKNITNIWLSEQLGVSLTTVSSWCQNASQPRMEMLFAVASVLEVEPWELVNNMSASGYKRRGAKQ